MLNTGSLRIGGRKQLLAEDVYQYIGRAILDGDLQPRERIRDVELAQRLHVSRMPVREALQRLERIGLVRMYPSRYTEVSAVSPATIAASLEFAAFQSGVVAHLAAARMDEAQRATASDMIDEIIAAFDDPAESSKRRSGLFEHLSMCTDNFLQRSLMEEASLALTRNLQGMVIPPEQRDHVSARWETLRTALAAGDPAAAERAARAVHGRE